MILIILTWYLKNESVLFAINKEDILSEARDELEIFPAFFTEKLTFYCFEKEYKLEDDIYILDNGFVHVTHYTVEKL